MNNAVGSKISIPPTWRGRAPGFFEFNGLLNLLDEPAMLVDLSRGLVLSANSSLLKLTAFTQAEVLTIPILDLLPDITRVDISAGDELTTVLNRHSREAIQVIARPFSLDTSNQWFIFTLIPLAVHQQNRQARERQEEIFAGLQELAFAGSQPDLQSSLDFIIRAGGRLMSTNILCIYQAEGDFPQFHKAASLDTPECDLLPDILPASNLMRQQVTSLWLPGKKVDSDLHRTARIANLSYLITAPVGHEGAWLGLLAAGDTTNPPPERLVPLMEILAAHLTTALDHHILSANLQAGIEKNANKLIFHDIVNDKITDGVILLQPDLTILEMNPAAELMLGYASQEVIGQHIEAVLIGTETLTSALKSALQGISTPNLGNLNLHRRSGQTFPAHIQTIPVESAEALLGIAVLLTDTTENEQIRVQTQQLEQRAVLGEVTAIFAHEVRNPVNNISTTIQYLGTKIPEDDPNHKFVGMLQQDCSRLLHLMESVLNFSRPMEYHMEATDLGVILTRMLERWTPRMTRVNITPYFQAEPSCPKVLGDPRALEQVFTNLVSNAVQAMTASGGTLALKMGRSDPVGMQDFVEVSVSDTGPGIPEDIREHIFEPFRTTKPQEGTGLGLAITKRIVTAHKGNISLTTFPGGTVFTVCLPAIHGEYT